MSPETVSLTTLDGVTLEADVIRADADIPRAFVVIAHPHPLYGGDRSNHVVRAIQKAAHSLGCHSIAPDFRGAGGSMGEHDEGTNERLDLAAACEFAAFIDENAPVVMCGYSFGAAVALNVSHQSISGWFLVAPPVAMLSTAPVASGSHLPKRIVMPEHDQFTTRDQINRATAAWANTTVDMIPGVDHFLLAGADETCLNGLAGLLEEVG